MWLLSWGIAVAWRRQLRHWIPNRASYKWFSFRNLLQLRVAWQNIRTPGHAHSRASPFSVQTVRSYVGFFGSVRTSIAWRFGWCQWEMRRTSLAHCRKRLQLNYLTSRCIWDRLSFDVSEKRWYYTVNTSLDSVFREALGDEKEFCGFFFDSVYKLMVSLLPSCQVRTTNFKALNQFSSQRIDVK